MCVTRKTFCLIEILFISCLIYGCREYIRASPGTKKLAPKIDSGSTIGSVAEVISFPPVPVEGFGLVGGLNGTGSAECPPDIRAYLVRYILTQVPGHKIDVEKFINNPNTAVVRIEGMMPAAALKNQHFDVRVSALPGTQTTSLEGGWLYRAELRAAGFAIATNILATVEGPVFIDKIDNPKTDKKAGYILGGGTVLDEYGISVTLRRADYRLTSAIRNRLNERYIDADAKAVSPSRVELFVPGKYKEQKERFVEIVKATYLDQTPDITDERIKTFVRELAVSDDKHLSEIALEAIGYECVSKLATLLNSSNEQVRLRAARCMLNLGDGRGLEVLREIAVNKNSTYRTAALEAIAAAAGKNDAAAILRRLLRDDNFNIRLAAYEHLRKLDDIAVTPILVGRKFYLEQVATTEYKDIFVYRSGRPRVVLFGAPIYSHDNIFIQSAGGNITIDSMPGQKYVSLMRKHPARPTVIGPLKSSHNIADIIQTLCEEPVTEGERKLRGLDVSYDDMIALLKKMCDKGAIRVEFRAGPLPKID